MTANIETVLELAQGIITHEYTVASSLQEMEMSAEYGRGAVREAIAEMGVAKTQAAKATALADAEPAMAAAHALAAKEAEAFVQKRLESAKENIGHIVLGLRTSGSEVADARAKTTELVSLDDTSKAAEIRLKVEAQPGVIGSMAAQAAEIDLVLPDSRDIGVLQDAADRFGLLGTTLEEQSGVALGITTDTQDYMTQL